MISCLLNRESHSAGVAEIGLAKDFTPFYRDGDLSNLILEIQAPQLWVVLLPFGKGVDECKTYGRNSRERGARGSVSSQGYLYVSVAEAPTNG